MKWRKILELLGLKEKSISNLEERLSQEGLRAFPLLGEFDSGYVLDEYRDSLGSKNKRTAIGELVYRFKYKFDKGCGIRLAGVAARFVKQTEELSTADLIVAVPPSFTSRPFDPISLLAEEISTKTNIPYRKDIIKRVRLTKLQKRILDKRGKMQNVRGAFELSDPDRIKGKKVLLVDDLYASGATINDITRILKETGARQVCALTLIKTSWGRDW